MADDIQSCTIAPFTKDNHATSVHTHVTNTAPPKQPLNLLSLAIKILERNKRNTSCNLLATTQLHDIKNNETHQVQKNYTYTELHRHATGNGLDLKGESKKSCTVALPIKDNHATELICPQCGYFESLCACKPGNNPSLVTCNGCEHFTPDKIGDGAGIGDCGLGVKWTQEYNGRKPLFRYAERHCNDFSKLMS